MKKSGLRSALLAALVLCLLTALLCVSAFAEMPSLGSFSITVGQNTLTLGDMTPVVGASVTTYSYEFASDVASVKLKVAASDPSHTVTVNGSVMTGDTVDIALDTETAEKPYNEVMVTVSSDDKSVSYAFRLIRRSPAADDDATLASLSIPGATLSPAFDPAVTSYTASVGYDLSTIAPVFAATNPRATAQLFGTTTLEVGQNTFFILVTPVSGAPETYEIVVTREKDPLLSDATLSALSVEGKTLGGTFSPDVVSYDLTVNTETTAINVIATPTNPNAKVVVSDDASQLSDYTLVRITVTSEDESATKIYTIVVTRSDVKSSDASLSALSVEGYALSPAFDTDTMSYAVTVPFDVTAVTVNATPTNAGAHPYIGGNNDLAVGRNTVTVFVMAEDGVSQKAYIIVVTRQPETPVVGTDATLAALSAEEGQISPDFAADVLAYTMTVGADVTALHLTAAPLDPAASAVVTGADELAVGENTVTVTVTAADGTTTLTYTITVTRAQPENPPATDADPSIQALKITDAATGAKLTLTPAFDPEITEYTATVSGAANLRFSVTLADKNAKWRWQDADVSGYTRPVANGENVFAIAGYVTGADGKRITKVYTITVTADGAGQPIDPIDPVDPPVKKDASLKSITFSVEGLILAPAFDPAVFEYSTTVPNDVTSITVSGEANDPAAYVTSRTVDLAEGDNVVTLIVVSGSETASYTVHVYRTPNTTPLSGILTIHGEAKVGSTLTALFQTNEAGVTLDCAWYVDGTLVGSGATYTVTEADAGKTVTLTATGNGKFTGTVTADGVRVAELPATDPAETDPVDPVVKREIPPIVIILLILGCIGIVAAFVLFIMRSGKGKR